MIENEILKQSIDRFCEKIDIRYQVNFVESYAKIGDDAVYGGKHAGSDAEHEGARFIAERLKQLGLEHVELVPCQTNRYQFNGASLTGEGIAGPILPYGYVSPGTENDGLTAAIVDVGKGTKDVYENQDVRGRMVLLAAMGTLEGANLTGQMEEAILNKAAAILIYAVEEVLDDETIRVQPPNIISPVPIVGICRKDAELLKTLVRKNKDRQFRLKVDAEFLPDKGTTYNVIGEIPGRFSDEKIIYTAHLDHYFRCLQDNMASCATLLGIAKAIKDSGIIPNRTIVFAFHGSHETGGADSRYPYIYGSYQLTHKNRPEWTGTAIADINFEYTALHQKNLRAITYPGANVVLKEYLPYAPELVGGFDRKSEESPPEEYYLMSWSDNISYLTAGIPPFGNDVITEQMYEGESPYIGRDHSNKDNWEIFDEKALEDTCRYYGGLGLFLDSWPYMYMDFTEVAQRIRNEVDFSSLETMKIPTADYLKAVSDLEEAAAFVKTCTSEKNDEYLKSLKTMSDEEKSNWFARGNGYNRRLLQAFHELVDQIEKINQFDFLSLGTVKYLQNTALMTQALEYIKTGLFEEALNECLASVDLCLPSVFFSKEVASHMEKQICGEEYADRRTWARGKELHIHTHYDLVNQIMEGKDREGCSAQLMQAIEQETSYIREAMARECDTLNHVTKIIEKMKEGKVYEQI